MGYKIRPSKRLVAHCRNQIYRAINNGQLPVGHARYPAIEVGDHIDLDILMHEIAELAKDWRKRGKKMYV